MKYISNRLVLCKKENNLAILYVPGTNVFMELNSTATFLWNLLSTPNDKKTITKELKKEYQVSEEDAKIDVTKFLKQMLENELICRFAVNHKID